MKIYTKKGDRGETSLLGAIRVGKDDLRVESYGTLDELNCILGVVVADSGIEEGLCADLIRVQHHLFRVGAMLADPKDKSSNKPIGKEEIRWLEERIDSLEENLAALTRFLLPGGAAGGAALHHARSVCRRAERLAVSLNRSAGPLPASIIPYLNRLSDYLFVAAREANRAAGFEETPWDPEV